jgi:hypothetical protein
VEIDGKTPEGLSNGSAVSSGVTKPFAVASALSLAAAIALSGFPLVVGRVSEFAIKCHFVYGVHGKNSY